MITSAKIKDSDCKCVFGYDDKTKEYFKIDFEEIPVRFPGTGKRNSSSSSLQNYEN